MLLGGNIVHHVQLDQRHYLAQRSPGNMEKQHELFLGLPRSPFSNLCRYTEADLPIGPVNQYGS